ncbi:MAG: T9SS type A sorting domain-containing protein [Flavobacteriales bacterium]|nr:T9SS type A sorting domain-containing protein [Flavobacteriales bacterium]
MITSLVLCGQGAQPWPADKWPTEAITIGTWGPSALDPALPMGGPPPNDDCSGATIVELPVGGSVTVNGDNTGASDGIGFGVPEVWEAFTVSACVDLTVSYCGTDPAFEGAYTLLFMGCPFNNLVNLGQGSVTTDECGDGNFSIFFPQVPVGTYFYAVLGGSGATGPYTLTFSGTPCTATPPDNDECDGAIELVPAPACLPVTGDVFGALVSGGSLPAVFCAGFLGNAQDDVWYSFTATATEHTIIVDGSPAFDATVDLRAGSCANSVSIACADAASAGGVEVLEATGLTIGEIYFVRVNDWYGGMPATTTFEICVIGPGVVEECEAFAGTLVPIDANPCLEDGTAILLATPSGDAVVPDGYGLLYVLTQGEELVIINAQGDPFFGVGAEGLYTIHTLVYDPATLDLGQVVIGVTTGSDIAALLIENGGDICASLDVAGAQFNVQDCSAPPCDAYAGTLTGGGVACVVAGTSPLTAIPEGNASVPQGYEVIYVLTQGAGLTIIGVNTEPEFIAEELGLHTIHTLVYDPTTLDLSIVELGVTTGFDVNALLIQGGGEVCASLDVVGAQYSVEDCQPPFCEALAGTLSPIDANPCLEDGTAILLGTPGGDAVVPDGYGLLYVLTQGEELVIINAQGDPFFGVGAEGLYTIHTLVYDPATLDLGQVVIGVTTGSDIAALLIENGGDICASLDVAGAQFNVQTCLPPCEADAGSLLAVATPVCLVNGNAIVAATPQGDANVPDGYEVAYALTQGPALVIVALSGGPVFSAATPGQYTIHTLVYDPATVDPGQLILGETTGFDINALLIQGGGSICGALDVTGATVIVLDCIPENDLCANATELTIELDCAPTAGDNTYSVPGPGNPACDFSTVGYTDVWYTFNAGLNSEVEITLDPIGMTDWGIVVLTACGGAEVACEVQPSGPLTVPVTQGEEYLVRIFSNLQFGTGGAFTVCITGQVPSLFCDGGTVATSDQASVEFVCQDGQSDVIAFVNSSISSQSYTYVLTNALDIIITQLAGISLDFNGLPLGEYRVWGISHNGALVGAVPGNALPSISSTGACLSFSGDFVTVFVEICTGMEELIASDWTIHPNPAQGEAWLRHDGAGGDVVMEVFDAGGRLVHTERWWQEAGAARDLDFVQGLVPGLYTVRLTTTASAVGLRLVVAR